MVAIGNGLGPVCTNYENYFIFPQLVHIVDIRDKTKITIL